jgi:serine/threonine-protein kinase SRK2
VHAALNPQIKLIKRPIPKPAIAVIKREIKIQSDLGQVRLASRSSLELWLMQGISK